MKENKGIVNKGTITSNNIAVGDHASIHAKGQSLNFSQNDVKELSALFDELISSIKASSMDASKKEDILSSVKTVKEEVQKEKPSKITIGAVFKSVLDNLKYVKELLPLGTTLWEKVSPFL